MYENSPTLFAGGCSFSDARHQNFPESTLCWGEVLAEKLEMNYNHDAVETSGNNDRIWRVLTEKIMNNEITSKDKVFLQYTSVNRKEFCTWKNPQGPYKSVFKNSEEDLYIVNYKDQCHTWYNEKEISSFLKKYEFWLSMDEYDNYIFNQRQFQFQALLDYYNIDAYILVLNSYQNWKDRTNLQSFSDRIYIDNDYGFAEDERYSPDDPHHLSDSGHKKLAQKLYEWLQK